MAGAIHERDITYSCQKAQNSNKRIIDLHIKYTAVNSHISISTQILFALIQKKNNTKIKSKNLPCARAKISNNPSWRPAVVEPQLFKRTPTAILANHTLLSRREDDRLHRSSHLSTFTESLHMDQSNASNQRGLQHYPNPPHSKIMAPTCN